MERRGRHRLAVAAAVRSADFLSDLAEGLAGVNTYESNLRAPKKLVAAALKLDALSEQDANVHAKNNKVWTALLLAAQNSHLALSEESARQQQWGAEGLAGVNMSESGPGATEKLLAAALQLDALSEEGARQQQRGAAARAPKRRRRGAA